MAKYFYTPEDHKVHYHGLDSSSETKPYIGAVYDFWDEIYKGEKNKKGERNGNGSMEWTLDATGKWRFEEWSRDQFFGTSHKSYKLDDKLNPDRKLTKNKILFKGEWKDNYPHGKGKFYLNNKLFCEATLKGGSLHGKAKIELTLYTACFGIYNTWIQIPGYSDLEPETEEEFVKLMNKDKDLGKFEGECKYGLTNGYGELIFNNGISYKGNWLNGYPYGSGIKIYDDGREEHGEFGILDQGTLKPFTDYVEEKRGIFLSGSRKYANGDTEKVDKRTLFQKSKSTIKDFIE